MNHRSVLRRSVCYIFIFIFLFIFPSGCFHHAPTLYERSPHTVAVVITSSPDQNHLQGMPSGKGDGALRGAGSVIGSLWSGCGKVLDVLAPFGQGVGVYIVAISVIGTVVGCVVFTPIAGIAGATQGAVTASPARDVDRVRQGFEQSLPDRDRATGIFEQSLYDPREKVAGHAFKSGKTYGLLERRPEGDYRDLHPKGVDAVLEVDGLAITLSGNNLGSQLSLRACASVKLTDTLDKSVLYRADRCEGVDSTRSLDAWSADQWAAVKSDSVVALERLASNLNWYIFHGNKEDTSVTAQGDKKETK